MNSEALKEFLDEQTIQINIPAFIESDPVQFPRRYTHLPDIEIAAFLSAIIAWGNRTIILKSAERMFSKLGESPCDFVLNEGYKSLGTSNIHRTFFEPDLVYLLKGFRSILLRFDSIGAFLTSQPDLNTAWDIAKILHSEIKKANDNTINSKCFPSNFEKSALKRINLALRWLVRNDGIVDLGVWTFLNPGQLHIPLDIHAGNTARKLGLLQRSTNDRIAVEQLTVRLRDFCPEDPAKYDFALFGIGIANKNKK
jgi:uncharacterized protein (TIGR02757 family)